VHETREFATQVDGVGTVVRVFTITGDNVNVTNTETEQTVGIRESEWDGQGPYTFPKHSMTMLRWKA